jgi:ribonuclease III
MSFKALYRNIDYQFNNEELVHLALTHRSYSSNNNERLEYLGDSIVNFIIAEELFTLFEKHPEGQLSRLRATLIKKETLAAIANELSLGNFIKLGGGELKSGGFRRESILADALEALIAAMYKDSSLDVCREKVLQWFQSRLSSISLEKDGKDAKTSLQELLQAKGLPVPNYTVTKTEGKDHNQVFYIKCQIEGLALTTNGEGSSRKRAEQIAAEIYIQELSNE